MTIALQTKNIPPIRPHLWTREEFDNMVLAGIFRPEARLELIEGEILEMGTQSSWHSTAVQLVHDTLRSGYGKGFVIRNQMPLAISDDSEPVPDIAVVIGSPRDPLLTHWQNHADTVYCTQHNAFNHTIRIAQ